MQSKYALKVQGKMEPTPQRKPPWRRRICSGCKRFLFKGHGFPSKNGRSIYCGGCVRLR